MFGGTGAGGGFTFGSTTTTTPKTTAGGGFAFGGTNAGFSFGQSNPTPTATTTSLFSTPAPAATATGGFSFGGTTATTPAATTTSAGGGFTLGAPAATTSQPTNLSTGLPGFSLGAAATQQKPGGFTLGTAATSTPVATATGGFKLGTAMTTAGIRPTATPTVTPGGSFTFATAGAAVKPTLAVPATSAAPTTSTAPLNFGFGTQAQPTATSGSTAVKHTLGGAIAPSQSSFGSIKLGTATTTAGTATSTPATGFTLGGTTTTTTTASTGLKLGGAATSTAATGLGFAFGTASSSATTTSSTAATTTVAGSGQKLPVMNYRQLEESINKWTVELQEQEKIFLQQATQVNAWDRLLIENGEKITQLNSDVERVKLDQQRLDNELDFIRAQQRELEELLSPLETSVQQLPSISYQQHADLEREHTYQLAENIDAQLKRMVQDLKEIIDHVNSTNSSQDNNDPFQQITKILNAHMDSLQWVDQNSSLLSRRVEEISKQMDLQRKEQERNFRLAYD